MNTPDKAEKALSELIAKTEPGPPPPGAMPLLFILGVLVGGLAAYFIFRPASNYQFHATADGHLWRVNHRTGTAEFAVPSLNRPQQWHKVAEAADIFDQIQPDTK